MPVVTSTIGQQCPCSQGEHLKNQKRKLVVPALLAAVAVGSFGITTASAKSATPRAKETCPAAPVTALDKTDGIGAGIVERALACGEAKALEADSSLPPFVIGVQNPEGDPNGSFPEYTVMAQAAVDYINKELGGIGADYAKKKGGRPIKLEVCKMVITPTSSQACANELASKNVDIVYSTLNFFGNHFAVYNQKGIPVVVGTPITPGDFTSSGVYAIGGGGGCLGTHTGLVKFATQTILKATKKAAKIGIPWANTAPGVYCYHDLEKKPVKVLNGKETVSSSKLKGTMPGLEWLGVPILPAATDVTADVTKIIDFKPNVIIFSGQGSQCWTIVKKMQDLGWTPAKTPLVLSGSCIDLATMKTLGNSIKGVYTVGAASILDPTALPKKSQLRREAEIYGAKGAKYASDKVSVGKGFGTQGFTGIMTVWSAANQAGGLKASGATVKTFFEKTKGHHSFASTPLSCKTAKAPYTSVCNALVSVSQWNGKQLKALPEFANISGLDLIAGANLDFGKNGE